MKRTNLKKDSTVVWRGQSLKDMDDQEYIIALEQMVDYLTIQNENRKNSTDRWVGIAKVLAEPRPVERSCSCLFSFFPCII